jgi:hypothetical protein
MAGFEFTERRCAKCALGFGAMQGASLCGPLEEKRRRRNNSNVVSFLFGSLFGTIRCARDQCASGRRYASKTVMVPGLFSFLIGCCACDGV